MKVILISLFAFQALNVGSVMIGQAIGSGLRGDDRYGSPDCPCIGIDDVEGDTLIVVKDGDESKTADYPADVGARCEAWDADSHPSCPGESWCKQKYCFVDPCKCKNIGDLPKPSGLMAKAKYQGKPVHFSYATCGGKDSYTQEENKNTARALEKTCSVEVDSAKWGTEGCRCIGMAPQEGTLKVKIDGKLEDFPADTGATCKKWDEKRHPKCKEESPPSWCSQAWCYVDPCSCDASSPPKTSGYLEGKPNFQGKPIYFSYEACGGTDHYSANDKTSCVFQKTKEACAKLEKCGWTGSECLGKELVSVCKEPTGADDDDDEDDDDDDDQDDACAPEKARLAKVTDALAANLREQEKHERALKVLGDQSNQEIDKTARSVANQTDSPAMADMLGRMWKEMRMFERPASVEFAKDKLKDLKHKESALKKKRTEAKRELETCKAAPKDGKAKEAPTGSLRQGKSSSHRRLVSTFAIAGTVIGHTVVFTYALD